MIVERSLIAMKRKASVFWEGGLKDGRGAISTESGVLSHVAYSFSRRFENEPGTNPEELVAAAHAPPHRPVRNTRGTRRDHRRIRTEARRRERSRVNSRMSTLDAANDLQVNLWNGECARERTDEIDACVDQFGDRDIRTDLAGLPAPVGREATQGVLGHGLEPGVKAADEEPYHYGAGDGDKNDADAHLRFLSSQQDHQRGAKAAAEGE